MISVLGMHDEPLLGMTVVDVTSRSTTWSRGLSPFVLGPCKLWGGHVAHNVENGWQFSKVYRQHYTSAGINMETWLPWAKRGWANKWAHRYPMGRNVYPVCTYWNGKILDYIQARKEVYIPLYTSAALVSEAYHRLVALAKDTPHLALRDFDGYDWRSVHSCLDAVIDDPMRKMGHAFVLAMLLRDDAGISLE